MSLLIDLLVGLLVQVVGDLLGELLLDRAFEGAAAAMQSRQGRYALTGILGVAVGAVWGFGWRDDAHAPRLLGVGLVCAFLTLLLRLVLPPGRTVSSEITLRQLFVPPWRWTDERLTGLFWLNLGLAAGVALGYGSL